MTPRILAGAFASAVVGGTTSQLTGGKFANGAVTAAFGYLFNYDLSRNSAIKERSFDPSDRTRWRFIGAIKGVGSRTFVAGERIGVETSSISGGFYNAFRFEALPTPLRVDGTTEPSIVSPWWFNQEFSSGATGMSTTNQFVIQSGYHNPRIQWKVSIPPQAPTNGNVKDNELRIFVPAGSVQ